MGIKTVFLDMDEVLTDFNRGVCEAFNIPYQYENFFRNYKWFSEIGRTREQVNAICDYDFWENLEWMHDGHDILRMVEYKFAPAQIYLLTTPMPNVGSSTGKMIWVRDNMPMYYERTIITQAPKHLLARPDTLLIDDKDENVEGFATAGGYSILINRPWNKGHERAGHTVSDLELDLLDIKDM